jgi:hypothetical protein
MKKPRKEYNFYLPEEIALPCILVGMFVGMYCFCEILSRLL